LKGMIAMDQKEIEELIDERIDLAILRFKKAIVANGVSKKLACVFVKALSLFSRKS